MQYIQPKMILNDGTEYTVFLFRQSDNKLTISIRDVSMAEIISVVSDMSRFDEIVILSRDKKYTYRQFNVLDMIHLTYDQTGVELRLLGAGEYSVDAEDLPEEDVPV